MKKPTYKVKIGSGIFDSSVNPEIISISLDLDINVPSDFFKIILKRGTKASAIKNGDAVVIELGYEENLSKVLTGTINALEPRTSEIVVSGLSVVSILTSQKMNQVYEKQTAGSIVKDLAARAGISLKDVMDGLSFPVYVVDDTKDVYAHMKELALKCGFDLFISGDGKLVFKKYARQAPKPFKFGRDIIEAEVYEPMPIAACVKVYGESPSSFKGADTAHWNSKKVVEGVAGSGSMTFLIEDPVIRDKDTADKVAVALLEVIMIPLSGTLKAIGNARVGLGDTIEIKDMPDSRMNGEFEVTSISHHFNKTEGFVSVVDWIKKVTISPAEAPLAAPSAMPAPPKPPSPLEEQLESAKGELEEKLLELQDAVETSEMELEISLIEINSAMAEQDKLSREMVTEAEEGREVSKEAARETLAQSEELKKEMEAKKKESEDGMAVTKSKFEEDRKDDMSRIDEYEQEVMKLKEEGEKVDEATGKVDKKKEFDNAGAEAERKGEEIKKEEEDKKKEVEDKTREIMAKKDELKKSSDEAEKEYKAKTEETKKKLEIMTKETEAQINDARKTAEKIEKEADEKLAEVKKKAETARKEAEAKLEKVKKSYNEAREKVLEARKQAGMD